jgi:hypothetical protein
MGIRDAVRSMLVICCLVPLTAAKSRVCYQTHISACHGVPPARLSILEAFAIAIYFLYLHKFPTFDHRTLEQVLPSDLPSLPMMKCNLFLETGIWFRESGARLSYLVLTILVTTISHKTEKGPLSPLMISCNGIPPPPRFPVQRDLRALLHSIVRFTFIFIYTFYKCLALIRSAAFSPIAYAVVCV